MSFWKVRAVSGVLAFTLWGCTESWLDWKSPDDLRRLRATHSRFEGFSCNANAPRMPDTLIRLTRNEYENLLGRFLSDLAGPTTAAQILSRPLIQNALALIPHDQHADMLRMDQSLGMASATQWLEIATEVAFALSDPALLPQVVGACLSTNDQNCRDQFYDKFDKLLATEITPAEKTRFQQTYDATSGTVNDKYAAVIGSAVFDNRVYFRTWLGDLPFFSPSGDVYSLTARERADRVSFLLVQNLPDDPLMAAARDGTLLDPAVYLSHVRRLLQLSQGSHGLARDFMHSVLWIDRKEEEFGFSAGSELQDYADYKFATQMPLNERWDNSLDHLNTYLDYITYQANGSGGGVRELLTNRSNFSQTADQAEITGALWNGNFNAIPQTSGDRVGLLAHPAMALSVATSYGARPIMRGVRILKRLVCRDLTVPANTNPPADPNLNPPQTWVEQAQRITEVPGTACASCHQSHINPLGFVSARFGPLGEELTEHRLIDELAATSLPFEQRLLPGVAVDPTAIVRISKSGQGVMVTGVRELAEHLVEGGHVEGCLSQQLVSYGARRTYVENSLDACQAEQVWQKLKNGRFLDAFEALATDSTFLTVRKPNRGQ